jgi:hypothetical protein
VQNFEGGEKMLKSGKANTGIISYLQFLKDSEKNGGTQKAKTYLLLDTESNMKQNFKYLFIINNFE